MMGILILIEILFALGFLILPVVWLILLIAKKNRKHIGKAIIICFIGFIINGIAIGELGETSSETNIVTSTEKIQTSVPVEQPASTPAPTPVPAATPEPIKDPGNSRSNPIVVTSSQFANEIKSNTDAAKTKYNGKWVQITGKVLSAHNVAGMTSFYLYGEKGGPGLKVVCWVNEEVLKPFDYKGETHTFIGQVREVSTANSTEIGNCEMIE
jgi:hypothetical protein